MSNSLQEEDKTSIEEGIKTEVIESEVVNNLETSNVSTDETLEEAYKKIRRLEELIEKDLEKNEKEEAVIDIESNSNKELEEVDLNEIPSEQVEKLSNGYIKVPLAIKGKFKHGKYKDISFDDKDYEDIKRNFKNQVLGFSSYLTFGHPIEKGIKDTEEYIERSKAFDAERKRGNLIRIEQAKTQDKEVLFGLYETPENTYDLIKNKEYEYSSGEFVRNYKDKKTGENLGTVLVRTALTNAPFLPFEEVKVQALSENYGDIKEDLKNSLQSVTSFVIKLTAETINKNKEIEIMSEPLNPEKTVTEAAKTEVPEVVAPEKVEAVNVSTNLMPNGFDINKLVEQISGVYQEQLKVIQAQSDKVVESLTAKINSLQEEVTNQKQVSQAFSNTLSMQQKQHRNNELVTKGVSPALVQKFSLIENSLEMMGTASSVIKLSNSNNEVVEKSLVSALEELLIEAVTSEPVITQQIGLSMSVAHPNEFVNSIQDLVKANNDKNLKMQVVN